MILKLERTLNTAVLHNKARTKHRIPSLLNFETIRGSPMRPKWPKLASLGQKICTLVSVMWCIFCFQRIPFKNIFFLFLFFSFFFLLMRGGKEDPSTTISGPSSANQRNTHLNGVSRFAGLSVMAEH